MSRKFIHLVFEISARFIFYDIFKNSYLGDVVFDPPRSVT